MPRWGAGTHNIPSHHFSQPCLSFLLPGCLSREVKTELRWRKGTYWNFALVTSLPNRMFFLLLFHKEGGQRGARCVRFFTASTSIETAAVSNGLLNTSTELRDFFSIRYWRHCVPDSLTYLAKLIRLKLTGHPASLKIFHTEWVPLVLLTNISNPYGSVTTPTDELRKFQFSSARPLVKSLSGSP